MTDNITTVPHLLLENYEYVRQQIKIPAEIKGDMTKEHDYLTPILMDQFPLCWKVICSLVDLGIESGSMFFDDETGNITVR